MHVDGLFWRKAALDGKLKSKDCELMNFNRKLQTTIQRMFLRPRYNKGSSMVV